MYPRTLPYALLGILLVATTATAQPARGFARLDLNHDGIITSTEADTWRHRRFLVLDQDADGYLDLREYINGPRTTAARSRDRLEAWRQERFVDMDLDADGRVSTVEHATAGARRFRRLDQDDDGRISAGQWRRGRPHR